MKAHTLRFVHAGAFETHTHTQAHRGLRFPHMEPAIQDNPNSWDTPDTAGCPGLVLTDRGVLPSLRKLPSTPQCVSSRA